MTKLKKNIYITERDFERIDRMLSGVADYPNINMLRNELDRAILVRSEDIPSDVVTMNSCVIFKEVESGIEAEVTLVYPSDANLEQGKVSVLAPVGSALLGLSRGNKIQWPLPSGKISTYKIIRVLFQPEAAGRYDS